MDPQEALEEAALAVGNLAHWLRQGGFVPTPVTATEERLLRVARAMSVGAKDNP